MADLLLTDPPYNVDYEGCTADKLKIKNDAFKNESDFLGFLKKAMGCAIGDEFVNGIPYSEIVVTAREYIKNLGGFEKFAEWGLI